MYDNEIYSGESAGANTSGSCGQTENEQTENEQTESERTESRKYEGGYQGSSASAWNSQIPNPNQQSTQNESFNGNGGNFNGGNASNPNFSSGTGSVPAGKKKREKKPMGFWGKAAISICLGLFFGVFAGAGFYGVQQLNRLLTPQQQQEPSRPAISNEVESRTEGDQPDESKSGIKITDTTQVRVVSSDVSEVVKEAMPAMVSIVNQYEERVTTFFGQTYSEPRSASGSGIIVAESDDELLIVTNHHVVEDATQLDVTFIDDTTAQAQIKGLDSDMDLAVIAIPLDELSEETKAAISIATLGDSDALVIGEPVIAIGNALGYGQSATNGIVSALDREIELEDGNVGTFIQTNAAINPGNSGGALLNVYGEVIGINSNKIGGTVVEGMGYAIPISAAKPIISDLMLKETRTEVAQDQMGYMGIYMEDLRQGSISAGIFVTEVAEGSPAEQAGILYGDIIVKFEGDKVSTPEELQNALKYYKAGSTVTVTVMRLERGRYQSIDIDVVLGTRPAED